MFPGGTGMTVRQNDVCPKPSKVVALLPCPGLARSGGSSSFTVCGSCDPEGCLRATARTTVEVLVTCWLLFSLQEARQPPRRTATTPLESISSSPSFTLEVRLAPVQGAVAAVPGARAYSQPSSRSRCRQSSPRSCRVREQPRLAAGRNHGASSPSSSSDLDNSRGEGLEEKERWASLHQTHEVLIMWCLPGTCLPHRGGSGALGAVCAVRLLLAPARETFTSLSQGQCWKIKYCRSTWARNGRDLSARLWPGQRDASSTEKWPCLGTVGRGDRSLSSPVAAARRALRARAVAEKARGAFGPAVPRTACPKYRRAFGVTSVSSCESALGNASRQRPRSIVSGSPGV